MNTRRQLWLQANLLSHVFFVASVGMTKPCWSAEAQATSARSIPSSGTAIKLGDKAHLRTDASIFHEPGTSIGNYKCAPAGAAFRVDYIMPDQQIGSDGKPVLVQDDQKLITVHFTKRLNFFEDIGKCKDDKGKPTNNDVRPDTSYQVSASELSERGIRKQGFTWGALVIPYKYEFSSQSFVANPSTVAYFGYEGAFPGSTIAFIAIAGPGASTNSNQKTSPGGTPTDRGTQLLWTFGGGVIGSFGPPETKFTVGVLGGVDLAGSGSNFMHDGKPWVALSIGF